MIEFISTLKKRNKVLFYTGLFSLLGALICSIMFQSDKTLVLGINAWIKPLKFFLSITAVVWTMAWFMAYLDQRYARKVKIYSWMTLITFSFEMFVIVWQAANGRLSHFNITTPLYASLFSAMGVVIVLYTLWTAYIGLLFFKQKQFSLSETYVWGIRIGILFFVLFSFEGGIMASRFSHTVGNIDGSPGIPLLNWSKQYGDLRVAHFFGMHGLQIIPLIAYYLCTKRWQVFLFAALYFLFVVVMLVQAFYQIPFISVS